MLESVISTFHCMLLNSIFILLTPIGEMLLYIISIHLTGVFTGLTVESVDQGINGCIVKSITTLGAIAQDGRLQVGDYIVAINNESLKHVSSAQVRAILRRAAAAALLYGFPNPH